jgi:hypothetical protein
MVTPSFRLRFALRNDESKWRGVRRVSAEPLIYQYQPACKPGSVGPRPLARTRRDGHSSGTALACGLEQPTRTASLTSLPQALSLKANHPRCHPYSVLLPVGFTMPVPLPDPRCALTAPFHPCCLPREEAVRSLWHFPWGCPRRTLSGTVCRWSPDFPLLFGGAAVRPTDWEGMGFMASYVKPLTAEPGTQNNYREDVVWRSSSSTR